jgi:ketosteroid isomerase-like protein
MSHVAVRQSISVAGGEMAAESNAARTVRFIQTVASASSADAVAEFFAADAVMHELPNPIAPHGRKRTLADLHAAFGAGRRLLRSQTYDVRSVIEMGDEVAAEVEWTGILNVPFQRLPAGYEMKASIGMFFTFRAGKIVSQRNYDCYQPFDTQSD